MSSCSPSHTYLHEFLAHLLLVPVNFLDLAHCVNNNMEQFSDIFTLPDSPNPEYNPRENVLNHIRNMDEVSEAEKID